LTVLGRSALRHTARRYSPCSWCRSRPQQPLRLGALGLQPVPARPRQPLVLLIGELGVGDRDLALQRCQPLLLGRSLLWRSFHQLLVDRAVDAADKSWPRWRHGRDRALATYFPGRRDRPRRPSRRPSARTQRDVDADTFADQMLDRGQALRGCRHLDHQVLAADMLPKTLGLDDGGFGVQGEIGRDFQADEPSCPRVGHRPAAAHPPHAGYPRWRGARTIGNRPVA